MDGVTFRTDDGTKWGSGKGSDLSASEIDLNFWQFMQAINNLIANPSKPVEIVSITMSGSRMTFNMSDNTTIGPIFLPVLEFHWRGDWQPTTSYDELDIFRVAGQGLYLVEINHTSTATFNENAADESSANPLYLKMFAFAPAENVVYDIGFFYPGVLKDLPTSFERIYEEPIVRHILLPVVPAAGSFHRAYLRIAATTAEQHFTLYQNGTNIGAIHFNIGSNAGTVTLNEDVDLTANVDRLGCGRQAVDDATAGGLSLVLAAQQVLG